MPGYIQKFKKVNICVDNLPYRRIHLPRCYIGLYLNLLLVYIIPLTLSFPN